MSFSRLPLCSSRELIAGIERLGAYAGRSKSGSHASYHRKMSDGGIVTTTVVLSKREIPKSTLRKILRQLDISVDEFLDALGKRGR